MNGEMLGMMPTWLSFPLLAFAGWLIGRDWSKWNAKRAKPNKALEITGYILIFMVIVGLMLFILMLSASLAYEKAYYETLYKP